MVAVVTGAGGGVGSRVVTTLARRDERVVAVDIDEVAIKQLVEYAADEGLDIIGQVLDITDDTAVAVGVADIESRIGPITSLVNGAGVLRTGAAVEFSDADWAQTFDVNVRAPFVLSREVARHMIPRRAGSIVTIASNAALVARKGMTAYSASKAAANAFTKSLGLELAEHGIRCNVVAPGSTDTSMLRAMLGDSSDSGLVSGSLDDFKPGIPLGRVAQPQHIADAVAFLLSDQAAHITMHTLVVDGGATLGV
ncbi:SDR family NAD(P)-dependent oxidoreductase [Mycobacteroides salmoniphilum]|uniref:2,3-dihydro-2,3-dihydroxybenzoate dehydrogenase n=1 Tax=Mycobacteroides salmoniphilum TaxID=404941 RepID=A0A4R8SR53_9MYCO|nr:SDR family NAD(P)-dependent oxidoreductase [Mycobacteroides salmoniphilum]TEA02085.1 2,3-dihydro-2,3-dihydroxybenzoate dehydrogenase [Mycobacteroides salmoniphilum]